MEERIHIQNTADKSLLVFIEADAAGGLNVRVFNVEFVSAFKFSSALFKLAILVVHTGRHLKNVGT